MTNESDIEAIDELERLVSIESDSCFDGVWVKTCYELTTTSEPAYRAELSRSDLVRARNAVKRLRAENERLREAIRYAVDDMKFRMDNDYINRELHAANPYPLSCQGHKDDDGVYTFPMGAGAWAKLEQALQDKE